MYKRGLTRGQASEIAVTAPVTKPVTAVTGRISIPLGPKLRHVYSGNDRLMCELMHYAIVKAIEVEARAGTKDGPRSMRAFSIETTTLTPAHRDDEPREIKPRVKGVEVDLTHAVWETVYAMYMVEPYAVQLCVAIAAGYKWPQLVRKDPKQRGEKMLGYVRLNALYRMWRANGQRLLPMLLAASPRLLELIEGGRRKKR